MGFGVMLMDVKKPKMILQNLVVSNITSTFAVSKPIKVKNYG